ncbi:MAG: hypothetical protein DRI24_24705 [Deltaproteobacteria bacterium]|nr:MAG: hypothetical protein DRI24_24705 [Deltaproteobacteria bacterium]
MNQNTQEPTKEPAEKDNNSILKILLIVAIAIIIGLFFTSLDSNNNDEIEDVIDKENQVENPAEVADPEEIEDYLEEIAEYYEYLKNAYEEERYEEAVEWALELREILDDVASDIDYYWDMEEARVEIENAQILIDEADDEIDDSDDDGYDTDEAEDYLYDAVDILEEAEEAFENGYYDDAKDLALAAQEEAVNAIDEVDELEDEQDDEDEEEDEEDEEDEYLDEAYNEINQAASDLNAATIAVETGEIAGLNVTEPESYLNIAKNSLYEANLSYSTGDYQDSINFSLSSQESSQDAMVSLEEQYEEQEIISIY